MSIVFAVLTLIAGAVALVALLSYAIVWYERANADPGVVENRFNPENLRLAAWLMVQEWACLFITVLLYPLGWFKTTEASPEYGSGAPVLLLHGLFHNRACWLWTRYRLRRRGVPNVYTINLPPWFELEFLTEQVSRKVDELRHASGSDKVQLVGHSMGGIIARNFVQLGDGAEKVARCILLAAPNHGSKLAPFALSPLGKLLLPGSDFLQQLAGAPLPAGVQFTAVYSRHDNMVIPFESGQLPEAENVALAGIGHASLLYHPRAFETLIDALTEEQP
jgi:triacylglycerol esterase/lipase EstA (alpha/beta hydrolase family)